VHVTTGPAAGNVGAIVDIIDAKRLLVDGPTMTRQEVKLKDAFLTRILLNITDVPSQKELRRLWRRNMIDERYKRTGHYKHFEKMRKRAACTDFEFFKVRTARRKANIIKTNCLAILNAKYPRAVAKMVRNRKIDTAVALGYRTLKKLTPEQKAVKAAREKILAENRKHKAIMAKKEKKEKKAKKREARKARLEKKKADGTLKERKFVPKEKRVKKKRAPKEKKMSQLERFRKERDARLKEDSKKRKEHEREIQANRAAIKEAKAAGTKPPERLKRLKLLKPGTIRKKRLAKKAAKAERVAAEQERAAKKAKK